MLNILKLKKYIFLMMYIFQFNNLKALVHVFGDSHIFLLQNMPGSCLYWFSGRTMHRIGRDNINGINIAHYGVQEGDAFIISCGEIDVRCHIGKQVDLTGKNIDEVISVLVSNYIEMINLNRSQYKNVTAIVLSIIPPSNACYNEQFPFYGTLKERVEITKKMNNYLKAICCFNNILFLDFYDRYSLEDGSMNPQFSDGCVHIAKPYNEWVIECLYNIFPEAIAWKEIPQKFQQLA
jgi:hypothetical protein